MSTQTEIRIGSEFVGYRIDALIGRGGMGVVYRAYDLRLKRTVALKLIVPRSWHSTSASACASPARRSSPCRSSTRTSCRCTTQATSTVASTSRCASSREAICGCCSAHDGALDQSRTLAICGQVASALDAAHARGLVHRDVKPSNVLLDQSEHVYLADFGLTRRQEEQGTPNGRGPLCGNARVPCARADRRWASRRPSGCVLARLSSVRVPDRRASVRWIGAGSGLGAPRGRATSRKRAPPRAPRSDRRGDPHGDGQGAR